MTGSSWFLFGLVFLSSRDSSFHRVAKSCVIASTAAKKPYSYSVVTQSVLKLLSVLQANTKPCCHDVICSCQQVVAEANKPEWSGGHRGLQTYLQRLLHPTWDSRLVSPTKANSNSLMPNLNEETLKVSRVCIHGWKQGSSVHR